MTLSGPSPRCGEGSEREWFAPRKEATCPYPTILAMEMTRENAVKNAVPVTPKTIN